MRVLVAIDLSTNNEWLLSRAERLARAAGAVVDVGHVRSADASLEVIDQGDTRLRGLLSRLPPDRCGAVRHEVGVPEDVLVALSEEYDVLVVGPREPGALERMLRGTMAVRVLLRAHCPVLVPRGERGWSDQPRVLVGVDLAGPTREQVVDAAGGWAEKIGGTLDVVHAVSEVLPRIKDAAVAERAEREWLARHQAEHDALTRLLERVPEGARGNALLRRGDPEGTLVALSGQYDLVVVGNRNREGLGKLLLGAVARDVVRRSACDVLTLNTADL